MKKKKSRRFGKAQVLILAFALLGTTSADAFLGKKKDKKRQEKAEKILAENYFPDAGWEAYFKDDTGRTKPMLMPAEVNPDKDWLGLVFTPYEGPKTSLAVMSVENKTAHAAEVIETAQQVRSAIVGAIIGRKGLVEIPVGAIEELMTTALFNSSRFELIERKALGRVFAEQDLGATDRVAQESAARLGQVQGADYLILAAVNEWTPKKSRRGAAGALPGPLGAVAGGKSKAEVAMSFRIVDAASAQVLFATTERATAGSWAIGLAGLGPISGLAGMEKKSPVNYALMSCINKGVYKLAMWLSERPWRGSIAALDGDQLYINAGSDRGIHRGMMLSVVHKGKEITDPETGLVLGSRTEVIGTAKITSVDEKLSVATIIDGCDGAKRGDIVELIAEEEEPAVASLSSSP